MTNTLANQDPQNLASVPATPMQMLGSALASGHSAESLKEVVGLVILMENRQAHKDYLADYRRFKEHVGPIFKRREVIVKDRVMYKFASLQDVQAVVDGPLLRFNFSYKFSAVELDGGRVVTTCTLSHANGHVETSDFSCKVDGAPIMSAAQKAAGTSTFSQRYTLLAVLGLATEDDRGDGADDVADVPNSADDPLTEAQAKEITGLVESTGTDKNRMLQACPTQPIAIGGMKQRDYQTAKYFLLMRRDQIAAKGAAK